METTPDRYYVWEVRLEYLEESLNQIRKYGSTVISVSPRSGRLLEKPLSKLEVDSYIIIYYNPPIQAIFPPETEVNSSTMQ